jgi:poly(3-hydroxybutyrate) depolymerase
MPGSAGTGALPTPVGTAAQAGTGAPVAGAGGASAAATRPSSGCGVDPKPADTTIQVSSMRASFLLDLPAGYDKARAYPVVLAFHDTDNTAESFRRLLDLPSVTGADAIVVHPNCFDDMPSWDVQRDLALFEPLLARLGTSYCVDQARVFAVGYGSGALFVNALGCIRGESVRGIAPLTAAPPPAAGCSSQTAVWLLQSSADAATLGTALGNRDFWARQSDCNLGVTVPVEPSPCVEYSGCDIRFPVRYCEYKGDGMLPGFVAGGVWSFFRAL